MNSLPRGGCSTPPTPRCDRPRLATTWRTGSSRRHYPAITPSSYAYNADGGLTSVTPRSLVGAAVGAAFGAMSNVLTAMASGESIDPQSVAKSALAGAIGGAAGAIAAGARIPGGGGVFTQELGEPVVSTTVGGAASGMLDAILHRTKHPKPECPKGARRPVGGSDASMGAQ